MKKSSLVILVVMLAVGILATSSADAQQAEATASANANAAIIADITLTNTADMNFGDVIAGVASGTVVLTAASSPGRTVTGDAELGNSTNVSSAIFTVGGYASSTYSITLPGSIVVSSGGNNMTVDNFTSSPSGTGVLTAGAQTLYVGATLNVGAGQTPASDYTNSFNVTVAYN